jgi:hypothetical protein
MLLNRMERYPRHLLHTEGIFSPVSDYSFHASRVTLLRETCAPMCANTAPEKFETNIPRNETARPHSQFSTLFHVSVSYLYIAPIGLPILLYCVCGLFV